MDLNRTVKLRFRKNNMLKSKGMDIDSMIEKRKKEEIEGNIVFKKFIEDLDDMVDYATD